MISQNIVAGNAGFVHDRNNFFEVGKLLIHRGRGIDEIAQRDNGVGFFLFEQSRKLLRFGQTVPVSARSSLGLVSIVDVGDKSEREELLWCGALVLTEKMSSQSETADVGKLSTFHDWGS